jgi:hypothetical protein
MPRFFVLLQDRFFGNWDRTLTSISFSATIVGAVITISLVTYPDKIPQYIVVRDLLFWTALILTSLVVVIKYVSREAQIRSEKDLLSDQFRLSRDLARNYRNELFHGYFQPNIQRHKFTETERKIFRHLCSQITDSVKTSFYEYFRSRGIKIGNDLSVSVKLILTSEEVLDRFTLGQEEQKRVQSKDQWITTFHRDYYTYNHIDGRETGVEIYDIDKNTAFRHLIRFKESEFFHNNLQSLGVSYENENKNWYRYYNATLAVPIRYLSDDGRYYRCYGVLAIDSLNKKKIEDLYNNIECKYILDHAADLLATFFLFLEITEYMQKQGGTVITPATGA